jgi:hypothetical protein
MDGYMARDVRSFYLGMRRKQAVKDSMGRSPSVAITRNTLGCTLWEVEGTAGGSMRVEKAFTRSYQCVVIERKGGGTLREWYYCVGIWGAQGSWHE